MMGLFKLVGSLAAFFFDVLNLPVTYLTNTSMEAWKEWSLMNIDSNC